MIEDSVRNERSEMNDWVYCWGYALLVSFNWWVHTVKRVIGYITQEEIYQLQGMLYENRLKSYHKLRIR